MMPIPPEKSARRATAERQWLTCASCPARWHGPNRAHCSGCHRTFNTLSLFGRHRSSLGEHGGCLDPAALVDADGQRAMVHRRGIWRGRPMTEADKARAFGAAA